MNRLCERKNKHSDSSKRQSFQSQSNALYQNSCLCAEFLLAKFLQWVSRQRSLCLFASRPTSINVTLRCFACAFGDAASSRVNQWGLCPRGSVAPRRTSNRRFTGDCIHSSLLRRGATEPPDSPHQSPLHVLHVPHDQPLCALCASPLKSPNSPICQSINQSIPKSPQFQTQTIKQYKQCKQSNNSHPSPHISSSDRPDRVLFNSHFDGFLSRKAFDLRSRSFRSILDLSRFTS